MLRRSSRGALAVVIAFSAASIYASSTEQIEQSRIAAQPGHMRARADSGGAYFTGESVTADLRNACVRFSITVANGKKTAAGLLKAGNWPDYLLHTEIGPANTVLKPWPG